MKVPNHRATSSHCGKSDCQTAQKNSDSTTYLNILATITDMIERSTGEITFMMMQRGEEPKNIPTRLMMGLDTYAQAHTLLQGCIDGWNEENKLVQDVDCKCCVSGCCGCLIACQNKANKLAIACIVIRNPTQLIMMARMKLCAATRQGFADGRSIFL